MKSYLFILVIFLSTISMLAQTPTVAELEPTGDHITWYDAATGGNIVPKTTSLVNGTHYYASQTVNGVESTARLDVTATVVNLTTPTSGTHTPTQTEIAWNWSAVSGATGYKWNTVNTYSSATDMGSATTKTETTLTCNTSYTRYVWAYYSTCVSAAGTLTQTTSACAETTTTFNYSGGVQTFTVPTGINSITIEAWGAQGGTYNNAGGAGGYATGTLTVTPGQILNIYVGAQPTTSAGGFNGGGPGKDDGLARGGGGGSDVRTGAYSFADRVIVAAGGGGATNQATESGGQGGGLTGGDGVGAAGTVGDGYCGHGGTQSEGGSGSTIYPRAGSNGSIGQGGSAINAANNFGGGGGGGYYGGGSGDHGGGGGGSSYIGGVTSGSTTSGQKSGNGQIKITYNVVAGTTFTFTNASATGRTGPTQTQVNAAYTGTSLAGNVTINTQGIQEWTVPVTGTYRINARGAGGGANYYTQRVRGGYGASMTGDFTLTAGQVLKIVVGQRGMDGTIDDYAGSSLPQEAGGSAGGGSFVMYSNNTAAIVAGGGGGATTRLSYSGAIGGDGLIGTDGGSGTTASPGAGGTAGSGGGGCSNIGFQGGSGGGGITGNGGNSAGAINFGSINYGGYSFVNNAGGGIAGTGGSVGTLREGGFGGGGCGGYTGGGGGGYSGGGAGGDGGSGGGGSYNNGSNQSNTAVSNSGHGQVIITKL